MIKQNINYVWRVLATGFSFSTFGVGGMLLPVIAIPILALLPGSPLTRERRAKACIHYSFRFFVEMMRALGILSYSVKDIEALNRPSQLILANHPSLIDVVLLIAFIKRADCVVKASLFHNPFTKHSIKMAGYIANADPEQMIAAAAASLARGNSLIIFPESTRTEPGQPLSMKRGAANIALRVGCEVTPVLISCKPSTLSKGQKWYHIPARRFHISLKTRPNMDIQIFRTETSPSVAARKLTHFLEDYFTQELVAHE